MLHPEQLDRRMILKSIVSLSVAAVVPASGLALAFDPAPGAPLSARQAGEMDIHHIDTGRGNCTLIVCPDGTSIMIDAGAAVGAETTSSLPRPNASRPAGEWQARYAQRWLSEPSLDYFVATHLHGDHVGDYNAQTPTSEDGTYRRAGVSEMDARLPIGTLIDRGYPDYGQAKPPAMPAASNYLAYLKSRAANGKTVVRAEPGSDRQIGLKDATKYPNCKVRILAASGRVWTGVGSESESRIPDLARLPVSAMPNENVFSVALRLSYGKFSYYAGGDLSCDTRDGLYPWMDIETPVVRVAGRTEVAAADHHGYFDACGPPFVRALDAQTYVVQAWDVGHPGSAQMQRMLGAWPGHKAHDVFATDLLEVNAVTNRRFTSQLKSKRGHAVVRVAADGASYRIFVVDSSQEDGGVNAVFGPYICRA